MCIVQIVNRRGYGIPSTSKMEFCLTLVNGWKLLTIVKKSSISDVVEVLYTSLLCSSNVTKATTAKRLVKEMLKMHWDINRPLSKIFEKELWRSIIWRRSETLSLKPYSERISQQVFSGFGLLFIKKHDSFALFMNICLKELVLLAASDVFKLRGSQRCSTFT